MLPQGCPLLTAGLETACHCWRMCLLAQTIELLFCPACFCLAADYAFLEEVARADDVAKRVLPPFPAAQLPAHLAALVAAARRRGVTLRLMAPGEGCRLARRWPFWGSAALLPLRSDACSACHKA